MTMPKLLVAIDIATGVEGESGKLQEVPSLLLIL
jgi:hypothetical protein